MKYMFIMLYVLVLLSAGLVLLSAAPVLAANSYLITIGADKAVYTPGESVTLSGTLFLDQSPAQNDYLGLQVINPGGYSKFFQPTAGADGTYSAAYPLPSNADCGDYTIIAVRGRASTSITFVVSESSPGYHIPPPSNTSVLKIPVKIPPVPLVDVCGDDICGFTEAYSSCPEDCPNLEKPGECTEYWECTPWSECMSGLRTRTCIDLNKCGTEQQMPEVIFLCADPMVPLGVAGLSLGIFTLIILATLYLRIVHTTAPEKRSRRRV